MIRLQAQAVDTLERSAVERYFHDIVGRFPVQGKLSSFLVTHLLPDRPWFIGALATLTTVRAVLPKPKSITDETLRQVRDSYVCDDLSREHFQDPDWVVDYLEKRAAGEAIVLLDVGGYFGVF
jgi:adenosylhomocysteinase